MNAVGFELADVELVCLDMAGTTVRDAGRVLEVFDRAIVEIAQRQPTDQERDFVVKTMGQSKIEVFTALLHDEAKALQATRAFERYYQEAVEVLGVEEMPGATELFQRLRDRGVHVFLTTGFSASTQELLIHKLDWYSLIDGALCPTEQLRGRPHPDKLLAASLAARVTSMTNVVYVGDTIMDVQSGKNAGLGGVIGVLTGGFSEQALLHAGADRVLSSITELAVVLA
ncbi:HAD-IA family hydrolase [Ferrimicrobium sp.]|uniref:HAD-IA family hydrolase n=1 Tax=Ferrimicrobium sp. TaxID=2926050 RepID=UPI00262BCCCC|nr:HAD-IA family hydrolase [Ferrimicrobium sp.]